MKRLWIIILNILCWGAIAAFFVLSSRNYNARSEEVVCRNIDVKVLDSAKRSFITSGMVKMWLNGGEMKVVGREVSSINTLDVEKFISRRGYVKNVRVYISINGTLNVELRQRVPIIRFNTSNGYDFYMTEDNYIVPAQRHAVTCVPLVTGNIDFPFDKDYVGFLDEKICDEGKKVSENSLFLSNLINFVKFVGEDDFWNSFIVQIYVDRGGFGDGCESNVEIIPRVGNNVIALGPPQDYKEKLSALMSFYNGAAQYEGWNSYSYINLKYRGQVVCTK